MANYNANTDILSVTGVMINTSGGVSVSLDSEYVEHIIEQGVLTALVDSESARVDNTRRRLAIVETLDSDLRVANTNYANLAGDVVDHGNDIDSLDIRLTTTETDVLALETFVGSTVLTTAVSTISAAINELDADVGDTGTLTTVTQVSLVDALNELVATVAALTARVTTAEGKIDDLQGRVGTGSTPIALDDLSDVNLSVAPAAGEVLKYSGTQWAPGTDNT